MAYAVLKTVHLLALVAWLGDVLRARLPASFARRAGVPGAAQDPARAVTALARVRGAVTLNLALGVLIVAAMKLGSGA